VALGGRRLYPAMQPSHLLGGVRPVDAGTAVTSGSAPAPEPSAAPEPADGMR
jgi:hypothetical protein